MLTRFYAMNYKGLLMDPLALGRVNVFIGPNNCGKSNLFSAVSFLFDMFGRPEEGRGSLAAALKRREQGSIVTYGKDVVELRWNQGAFPHYAIELEVKAGGDVSVLSEDVTSLDFDDLYVQARIHDGGNVSSACWLTEIVESLPIVGKVKGWPARDSVLWDSVQISSVDGREVDSAMVNSLRAGSWHFHEQSRKSACIHFAAVVPPDIAASSRIAHVTHIDDRALDLTNLLHAWLKTPDYNSRLISELSPLLPGLTDLRVFEGGGYRWIQLQLRGEWRNLSELSDGTVIALLLAVILFAPTQSQTLIIDEPELNLHPAWARVVAGWIARQTSWAQVLIGTHSPEILDPLTEAFQQGDVSLFVFQRADEGFRVEPCPVERLAGRISEGWMLGDLYRVGDPALGGWPW